MDKVNVKSLEILLGKLISYKTFNSFVAKVSHRVRSHKREINTYVRGGYIYLIHMIPLLVGESPSP